MLRFPYLLILLSLLLTQFIACAQQSDLSFIPIDDDFNFKDNEEASFEENNEECEWNNEEYNLEIEADDLIISQILSSKAIGTTLGDENTGVAVANAVAQIIHAIGENAESIGDKVAVNVSQTLRNNGIPEASAQMVANQVKQNVVYSISNLTSNTTDFRNEIADVGMDGAIAYRNATDNGQDGGDAVGVVVANALKGTDNTGGVGNGEDQETQASLIADNIGATVATAVDNATDQSRDREEMIGLSIGNLAQAIKDNADQIGETLGNITARFQSEGSLRDQLDQISEDVKNYTVIAIENAMTTPDQVTAGVTDAVNSAAAGLQADTESFDTLVDNLSQDIANNIAAATSSEILSNTQGQT